jgi:transposase
VTAEKRLYLHLFYNAEKAADDKADFNVLLDQLEEELFSDKRNPRHESLYDKYYQVKHTPVRGITLTPKQEAIHKTEMNYGYFALISNDLKDPIEALEVYRAKDVIEKAFGNLKERLNMRRTTASSEQNLEGKLFTQFVALIYLSYIDKVMHDHGLYKNYTMQKLLDELDIIECFEQPGHRHHIGEMTKKQRELFGYFGVDVPS